VGGNHRRAYSDRWHLRHELPIHARALGWRFGYFVVLGAIAVVCSGLWLGFQAIELAAGEETP